MGGIAKVDCYLPSSGGSVGSGVSAMGIIGKVMAAVLGLACLGRAHALEQYESKLTASLPALRTGLPALDGPHSVDGRWTSESVPHAAAYVRHQTGANPQTGQPAWTAWFGNADLHRHEGPPLSMGEAMGHMPILNGNAGADGIAHLDSLTAFGSRRLPTSEIQSHATWSRRFSLDAGASFTFRALCVLKIDGAALALNSRTWFNVDPANFHASITMADADDRVRASLTASITSEFTGDFSRVFGFVVEPDGHLSMTVTNITAAPMTGTLGAGAFVTVGTP